MPDKDTTCIPLGDYCYRFTGNTVTRTQVIGEDGMPIEVAPYQVPEREICPYWERRNDQPEQENGYCRLLGVGDWESEGLSLLWDQVKECGINLYEIDKASTNP